ncbi:RNA polymerase sigma factor [Bordetella flabilis]|uniref:RNA polymerase subunit sigma n=1 Tax=Bordetella flabilis TaxID=463014 RepID=A0A193GKL8_9BORD|nr:RNA polymerase sigma factor [Bordetella flabilis]ANN80647.1 RNA polymerase subunit sigma [Bordetella flabilis]
MMRLVEPLIPSLRRYARALLHDRSAADDLVQDCLERVIGRWHQRRDGGDARKWVFAILHNLAMDQLRRARPRGGDVPLDAVDDAALAVRGSQEDGLHYGDVLRALEQLPEEQRSVLLLVSVEDMTYEEAAKVLDIPTGTVTSRLSRAREKLLRIMRGAVTVDPRSNAPEATGRAVLRRVK